MPRRSTKPEKPKGSPVSSPEVWEIVAYYAKHGAPKVKAVAKRLLRERT